MYQSSTSSRGESPLSVIGAGIAGAWQALLFAQAGHDVTLHERSDAAMTQSTSHWAGGMLAPWCEAEASEPVIVRLGLRSLDLWREHFPQTPFNGSLVVAHPRDRADFERFARLTSGHRRLDARAVDRDRTRRWRAASATDCSIPTKAMSSRGACCRNCMRGFAAAGGSIRFNSDADPDDLDGIVIDCRGLAARDTQPDLRGVKGEMIIIETDEVELSRPVRLIHPRWPLYVIPRGDHRFMLGATSIEAEDTRRQRPLGAGIAGRRLCGASGLRRSPHRRIRLRACARPFPTICRGSRSTARSRSTGFIVTASCWRRRWRS